MKDRRLATLLRGIASLLAMLALVVAVPVLLITQVGWPLPTTLPGTDALERAVQSGISDQVVINTLAVVAWIAWAQLALAILVEAVAVVRRRQVRRIPLLPGFQALAANLLAGILMIASTVQPARAGASPRPVPLVVAARPAPSAAGLAELPSVVDAKASTPSARMSVPITSRADEHPVVTVQRHDTYWGIAERTLGDGLRWREVLDLNVGRMLPDGTTIAAGDETLHAGWELLLPADAAGESATDDSWAVPEPPTASRDTSTVVVEEGDSLWTIAEDGLEIDLGRAPGDSEVDGYWRALVDANQDRYVEPGNPNLILPGQVLVLPSNGAEPPPQALVNHGDQTASGGPQEPIPEETQSPDDTTVTPTTIAGPTSPSKSAPAGDRSSGREHAAHAEDDGAGDDIETPVGVALGGLSSVALALGVKRLLDRRRRRFANAHAGRVPGPTPVDQHALHHAVVAQADEQSLDDLQSALGSLAAALAESASSRRPQVVRHSADSLEVLLDKPDLHPPLGWTSSDDGTIWTLDDVSDHDPTAERPLSSAPLLVTIGQPEEDAQLYLDLEAEGLVALTGEVAVATDVARSIVTELALAPLADTLRVIAIGDLVPPEVEVLEHLTVVTTWETVIDDIRAWATQSHEALDENDWPNTFVARGSEPDHDALVPLAVVADSAPPAELADCLRSVRPSAVAVVVVGEFDGALAELKCDAEALNLDWIDLACSPQAVREDELAEMCRLLVATDCPREPSLADELPVAHEGMASSNGSGPIPDASVRADDEAGAAEPPRFDVLVRLLGDITVEGGAPLNPKPTAVVAYLAIHRTVTTERLEEACWFGSDGTSHRKRLRDVMTECRDALGSQHFPANRSGTYAAGSRVGTDLDLFEWHVERAGYDDPAESLEHYQEALGLVTGKPFSYPNAARASFGWVDFEHHSTQWEYRVVSIAQACAEMHLDAEDPGAAITTLRRVLRAVPLNSALVETLMRAHIENDDRAGAEGVYREHAAALEQAKLGDPDDSVEQLRLELHTALPARNPGEEA